MDALSYPLVSIIIPCYNQGRFLKYALDSVLLQSYAQWECIIINDGSTDETEDVAKEYCSKNSKFKYLKTENSGLSSSRNTGIKMSEGKYIQLLDADDLIEPDKLKAAVEAYQSDVISDTDTIVYSSMRYFEHDTPYDFKILGRNKFPAHIELKAEDSLSTQTELIKIRNHCVISAPLYTRALFDNIGNFDEELTSLEDWDLHIRCLKHSCKFHHHYAVKGLTLIRLHNTSMMRSQVLMDVNYMRVLTKHNLLPPPAPVAVTRTPFIIKLLRRVKRRLLNN